MSVHAFAASLLLSTLAAAAPLASPPRDEPLMKVTLRDGQVHHGYIVYRDEEGLELELTNGVALIVPARKVRYVERSDATARPGGELWFPDANRTRYLYAPSAFTLKKNQAYLSQKELLFTAVAVGLTDNITALGGTVLPLWALGGAEGANFIFGVKGGFELSEKVRVGAGLETFFLPMIGFGGFGVAFGNATFGTEDAHFTLAAGKPFAFWSGGGETGDLMVVAAGNLRVASHLSLVTENWVLPFTSGIVDDGQVLSFHSLAVRIMGEQFAVDLGGVTVLGVAGFVPWLDFTYNFSKF